VLKTASQVGRAVRALTLSKNMKGTTDLGGILAHVGRQIDLERAVEPNSPRAYRLLWVSDGQPTGKQTRADWRGFADVDLRVAFFGATPGARAKVEHLFSDGGFGGVDHLLVVEHSHVHQMLPQLAPFFGRRPNPDLEKRLAALDARA
jgi:hypothetical protein